MIYHDTLTGPRPFTFASSRLRLAALSGVDAAIILLASAAVVLSLGGGTQVRVFNTRLGLFDPWRPAIAAVVLSLVRRGVAPHVPIFPGVKDTRLAERLIAERDWFAAVAPRPPAFAGYAVAAVMASLVWMLPHLAHFRHVPDAGDPVFSAWRLARFAHQLAHDPRHLFDGNIFYPSPQSLTYSDATVLQGIVAAPFILLGIDPLVAANALFFVAFPLNALAFFIAGWRLTGDVRAGFLTGVLGSLSPFHTEHYSHLELQYIAFAPLAIIALLRLLARPSIRIGLLLGALVVLQWLACMYFGLMLLTFLVPFGIVVGVAWRVRITGSFAKALGSAAVLVFCGFGALGIPYLRSPARTQRTLSVAAEYSATASEYGHPHGRLASYAWVSRTYNRPERELFPGIATFGLGALGAVPPVAGVTLAMLISAALSLDWSLGTNGLTYDELYRWLVPYRGLRVPARFAAFVALALVLLGAYGAARILRAAARRKLGTPVFLVLALACIFDLRYRTALQAYWTSVPSIYAAVNPDMILAEFPWDRPFDYEYFSTTHWARLVNGYSGIFPDSFLQLQEEVRSFPAPRAVSAVRRAGATHLTVNCRFYGRRCERVLKGLEEQAGVRLIASGRWEGSDVRLYRLE
jgi:hypothetical protein